jgi:hypothetical protein
MIEQSITLNLTYDLTESEWSKVMAVYRAMDGWIEGQELPCWFGPLDSARFVAASVEPSGLQISGRIEPLLFRGWVTKLCAKLTAILGREVYGAEA